MRYFKVKEGALVTRFGVGTYIGAVVGVIQAGERKGETEIKWTGDVVALPVAELDKYAREYDGLKIEGSLIEVDEAAYKKWIADSEAATEKEVKDREAAEKKAEAERLAAEKKAKEAAKAAAEKDK